jgi:hypothetical protein
VTTVYVLLALLLPWAAGTLLWRLSLPRDAAPGRACISLGAGYVVGLGLCGVALRGFGDVPVGSLFAHGSVWLGGTVLLLAALSLWRAKRQSGMPVLPAAPVPANDAVHRYPGVSIGMLVLLLLFGLLIFLQATALPSLAWDAWNAWQAKAKGWVYAGGFRPTLGPNQWLAAEAGAGLAVIAPNYPDTLPRLATWMASAADGWNETAVHLLWPGLWAALGLALFGYQRAAGIARLQAALVAGFVLTLPLVVAHATLAGYADLWVAAMLLLAVAQCERWLRTRRRADAALALLAAAMLPALKQEGAIWLLCLVAAMALAVMPRRWRWIGLGAAVSVFAISLPFGGLALPVPGLGWVRFAWGVAVVPGVGTLQLFWRPVADAVFDALFLRQNWSLLWYLAPLVLWQSRAVFSQRPALAALAWFFSLGFGFLALLFFFTDASQWAENLTSLNRVLLQIVPAFVFWLSLLWAARPATADTPNPSPR